MQILLQLSLIYVIGATAGWISEFFVRRAVHKKWINPGFLVGPNLPLYGTGTVLLYLLCRVDYSFISSAVLRNVFVVSVITCAMTAIEYVTGLIFIKGMHVKLWDYSDRFGNVQGIICPLFTLAWGAAGTAYYFLLHKRLVVAAAWIASHPAFGYFLGVYSGVMLIDVFYSFRIVDKIRKWAKEKNVVVRYEELKENIKTRAAAFKQKHSFILPFKSNRGLKSELDEYAGRGTRRPGNGVDTENPPQNNID
ncbi:MAG: putative ABC transporter permease [Candidatus Borkfalkiaceae bacterium]|nr:putative ABC transporter permease [Clostridia bacterium]MDY6222831.1 putative ABC transporter permease [Christensenellaceae bacterium]